MAPEPTARALDEPLTRPFAMRPVLALAISAQAAELGKLERIFARLDWQLRKAQSFREAMRVLCSFRTPIIICDQQLPDGSWKDILSLIAPFPEEARLLVMTPPEGHTLRSEVIEMGGYEVISKQMEEEEIIRVVAGAARIGPTIAVSRSSGRRASVAGA
ncbi:MAG TPA: response regulator [Bryobacteraceae bacterium]|nr:response regulator [Bryobacteraceae bacterium]